MKWVPLHIYQSDILIREVETVESKYENFLKELRCSESEETKCDFLTFRDEIEQRVIDLEEFYQININDARVCSFDKIRSRLQALLDITIEGNWINEIIRKEKNNMKGKPSIKNDSVNPLLTKIRNSKLLKSNANLRASSLKQSAASKLFSE